MIENLLKKVHYYYPIGMPGISENYKGYQEIRTIIEQKMDDLTVDKKPIHKEWMDDIKKKHSLYDISDFSFWQFPSYYISIALENNQLNGIEISKRAIVVVSLLANYFTVYIEDEYKYLYFDKEEHNHPSSLVLCNKKCYSLEFRKLIESLIATTSNHFINHEFIDHRILFNHKIYGGTILFNIKNFDVNKAYTFYDFLFSIDKCNADALIVLD